MHRSRDHCLCIQDLIATCKGIEDFLRSAAADETMGLLRPELVLIGSIYEGTRIGSADELDMTVKFQGLDGFPFTVKDNDPTKLYCEREPENHPMAAYLDSDGRFRYPDFLHLLLRSVSDAIEEIALPERIKVVTFNRDYKPCSDCDKLTESKRKNASHNPRKQCERCLVACSMTKRGPCLQFQWFHSERDKIDGVNPRVCTADLVPVFPIDYEGTVLDLFSMINKKMIGDRPEGWLDTFNGYVKRDRVIGESHDKKDGRNIEVAVKLLHFGPEDNYVIMPGQTLDMEKLIGEPVLNRTYCFIKALKDVLDLDVKSYFVKKILLRPEFIPVALKSVNEYECLYEVLCHPELRPKFEGKIGKIGKIDFGGWKRQLQTAKERAKSADSIVYTSIPLH